MLTAIFLAQAVAGPQLPAPRRPRGYATCPTAAETADVVVCARSQDSFRLHAVAPISGRPSLPKAEVHLGTAALAAEGEAAGLPQGNFTNRAMLHLRIPIGSKRKQAHRVP